MGITIKENYADRLNNIKSMFQVAYSKAHALNDKMQKEIDAKKNSNSFY